MKCTACGAELTEGTKFCTQCGHTVDGANVVDQGSGYGQETGYQQGTDYGYQQGANYGQGTNYQQGTDYGYGQGTNYQQGANYGQGSGYQQGTGYHYGAGMGYSYNQDAGYNPGEFDDMLTKKEFYRLPGVKSCRTNIRVCAILLYVCGGFTLLAALFLPGYSALAVLDALLLVGLGLWLQLGRSRVSAIIATVYGFINMGIALMTTHTIQGWLIPVAGICAIVYTFKYQKMWDNYVKNGIMP